MIRTVPPGSWFFTHSGFPGPGGLKGNGSRIRNTDRQWIAAISLFRSRGPATGGGGYDLLGGGGGQRPPPLRAQSRPDERSHQQAAGAAQLRPWSALLSGQESLGGFSVFRSRIRIGSGLHQASGSGSYSGSGSGPIRAKMTHKSRKY
jgi:hypothetical protein